MEAGSSGRLCGQSIQDRKIKEIIRRENISVAQSKGGGWGGGVSIWRVTGIDTENS